VEIDGQPGEAAPLSWYMNEDGTFTVKTMNLIQEIVAELINEGLVDSEALDGMTIPASVNEALRFIIDTLYEVLVLALGMAAEEYPELYAEQCEKFLADYPDKDALWSEIIDTYFGGNETPSLEEITSFVCGDLIRFPYSGRDGEKYIEYYSCDPVDADYYYISDVVAPNGAYKSDATGFAGNVFGALKDMCSDGWMVDNSFCLYAITGYRTDSEGYLYTATSGNVYVLDEDGNKVRDFEALLDENANIKLTGKSLRDSAVEGLMEMYREMYSGESAVTECPEVYVGELADFFVSLIEKYNPDSYEDVMTAPWETEEELRALAEEEIDMYISEMEEYGDAEYITEMLFELCGYFVDDYGYICEDVVYGYVTDEFGNRLRESDVMNDDGVLLMGNRSGETVSKVLNEYLEMLDDTALQKGDATADGKVNLADVTEMLKVVAGWENANCDAEAADVNGDGDVNLADVTFELKLIAGWDVMPVY
ncbi:MAG: dockerin type I repeat-containing protein, partial [Clostridia bacterium]|nr:dockerin type I repeat-containing protein [Clostridia bacterium]